MDEQPKETTKPQAKEPPKPKITWRAVEPRHYLLAQEKKSAGGKTAYTDYVIRLVERIEGADLANLTKAQEAVIMAAFEEEFGEGSK